VLPAVKFLIGVTFALGKTYSYTSSIQSPSFSKSQRTISSETPESPTRV